MATKKATKPEKKVEKTKKADPSEGGAISALAAVIDKHIDHMAKGKGASAARTALRALSEDEVTPRLIAALKSEDDRVRAAAVGMCTTSPRGRELTPLAALTACLGDESARVRMSTLAALNQGWGPSNGAVYAAHGATIKPALTPLLKDPDATIAKQAAIVWVRLGL